MKKLPNSNLVYIMPKNILKLRCCSHIVPFLSVIVKLTYLKSPLPCSCTRPQSGCSPVPVGAVEPGPWHEPHQLSVGLDRTLCSQLRSQSLLKLIQIKIVYPLSTWMSYYKSNIPKCSERFNIHRYLLMSSCMIDMEKENKPPPPL